MGWTTNLMQIWSKKTIAKQFLEKPKNAKLNSEFTFSIFNRKNSFLVKFCSKIKNSQFKLKPGTLSNSNKQNWMVVLTLSVIDPKHSFFYANLVLETKIVSLTWNLVLMLIRIWRTHWWCSLFLILTANTFFGWSWSKKSKLSLYSKIWCLG